MTSIDNKQKFSLTKWLAGGGKTKPSTNFSMQTLAMCSTTRLVQTAIRKT